MNVRPLPSILWVASRAPVPPFSGPTLKAHSGISALAASTPVRLVTFAEPEKRAETAGRLQEYWQSAPGKPPTDITTLEYGPPASTARSLLRRRFLFGSRVDTPALAAWLDAAGWQEPDKLIVLDDFVFAPLAGRYGGNTLFSPHDCMSALLRDSVRFARTRPEALKAWTQHRIALGYEREFYDKFLVTHLVTHRDRLLLQRINGAARCQVIPISSLAGPLSAPPDRYDFDVLAWGDLRYAAAARGAQAFLRRLRANSSWRQFQVAVIGRVPPEEAAQILGGDLLDGIVYAPFLEDPSGRVRHGRVTLIPDIGGSGIKTRSLDILAAGKCLACLYSQMEGLEPLCDIGALNGQAMPALTDGIRKALESGGMGGVGQIGGAIYAREFSPEWFQQAWADMVRRAVVVRGNETMP